MSGESWAKLDDLVDMRVLQRLQDTFAQAMGVAAVTVDRDGIPVTQPSNFCPVCDMIRSTEAGLERCMQCDADGGRIAHERGEPYAYQCYGGFLDAAAPIIIDNQYLGCILCGQVIPADSPEKIKEDVMALNVPLGLPEVELREALDEMVPLPRDRFESAVEMLSLTANHIIEMAVANKAQTQLLKEAQERAALQAILQETQLKALKAQINPHFLFNSLTLLSYTALEEMAPRTEEIAYTLSDLLRYSLRNMSSVVELGEEMNMVNQYLAIQKIRFGSRLESRIELDPDLMKFEIPCMVLQPLVENAVIHGAAPLIRPVLITVRAFRENGRLVMEVADTGSGMPPDVMEMIRAGSFDGDGQSLGIQNVIQRLQSDYDGRFSCQVSSQADIGTQLRLIIDMSTDDARLPDSMRDLGASFANGLGNQIDLESISAPRLMELGGDAHHESEELQPTMVES